MSWQKSAHTVCGLFYFQNDLKVYVATCTRVVFLCGGWLLFYSMCVAHLSTTGLFQMSGCLHAAAIHETAAVNIKTPRSIQTLCSVFEGQLEMELPGHTAALPLILIGPVKLLSAVVAQVMAILIFLSPYQVASWFPLINSSVLVGGK